MRATRIRRAAGGTARLFAGEVTDLSGTSVPRPATAHDVDRCDRAEHVPVHGVGAPRRTTGCLARAALSLDRARRGPDAARAEPSQPDRRGRHGSGRVRRIRRGRAIFGRYRVACKSRLSSTSRGVTRDGKGRPSGLPPGRAVRSTSCLASRRPRRSPFTPRPLVHGNVAGQVGHHGVALFTTALLNADGSAPKSWGLLASGHRSELTQTNHQQVLPNG